MYSQVPNECFVKYFMEIHANCTAVCVQKCLVFVLDQLIINKNSLFVRLIKKIYLAKHDSLLKYWV